MYNRENGIWRFSLANWKTPLAGREKHDQPVPPTIDIFSSEMDSKTGDRKRPREFLNIACDLFNSKAPNTFGYAYEHEPSTILVTLTKGIGYQGFSKNNVSYISYQSMIVDIATL